RYRGREDLYEQSFREFVLPGREHSAIAYVQARQAMAGITAGWLRLFEGFDLIVTPASPTVAPPHGVWEVELNGTMRPFRLLVSRFTRAFNLSGFPALTMPSGLTAEGLPVSVQLGRRRSRRRGW